MSLHMAASSVSYQGPQLNPPVLPCNIQSQNSQDSQTSDRNHALDTKPSDAAQILQRRCSSSTALLQLQGMLGTVHLLGIANGMSAAMQVAELQFRGVLAASQSSLASSSSGAQTLHASRSDQAIALERLQATVAQQQNVNSTLKADCSSLTNQLANAQKQIASLKKSQEVSQSHPDQANMAKQLQADLTQQQDLNSSLRAECDSLRQQVAEAICKNDEKERHLQGLQVSIDKSSAWLT